MSSKVCLFLNFYSKNEVGVNYSVFSEDGKDKEEYDDEDQQSILEMDVKTMLSIIFYMLFRVYPKRFLLVSFYSGINREIKGSDFNVQPSVFLLGYILHFWNEPEHFLLCGKGRL